MSMVPDVSERGNPPPTTRHYRTIEEVLESVQFGKLYRLKRPVGDRWIAERCRRKKGTLYASGGPITIDVLDVEGGRLAPAAGDFAFVDHGGTWSLWKLSADSDFSWGK